jgi:hypothetical protein
MSRKLSKYDQDALRKCNEFGLHPIPEPIGDDHHTDAPMTVADQEIGDALAYFLGGLFIDKQEINCETPHKDTYYYNEMTSADVWGRVVRALRIHGLQISDVQR